MARVNVFEQISTLSKGKYNTMVKIGHARMDDGKEKRWKRRTMEKKNDGKEERWKRKTVEKKNGGKEKRWKRRKRKTTEKHTHNKKWKLGSDQSDRSIEQPQ
ncbi:hypothetical protein K435DRAFT_802290 [Dendrothele bispora CBS 962.96]|uniref:Uncharacterized protein n=1 Tax=Dendrothele bispora (strain CBS 962.96) TaxID=1314807 RepID=A0A4S8LLC4_DENBC|nr:hypothetical protein K435DRAFT_802290 [Dendrothele bispora CBS 962.96]